MSFATHCVSHGSESINFELRRSKRKTLAIHVHPDMRTEVIAPEKVALESILEKVQKRAKWIKKQQLFFEQFQHKILPKQYVSGESHYYLGQQLRLKIKIGLINKIEISKEFIHVSSHYPRNQKFNQKLIEEWFQEKAYEEFGKRLAVCLQKFNNQDKFRPTSMIIKKLKKCWGSMTSSGRLTLNKQLIHAPIACIDYVIIHELCHRKHPNHSSEFWKFVETILPDWKDRKLKLDKFLFS